jgi:ribosomal-protein-alanine N-acetyltransferase
MNSISIVGMSERHIKEVAELERQCFTSPWSYDEFMGELSFLNAVYFVAEQDSNVVGFAGMHIIIDEGYITNIAVSPQRRQQGIADSLMQALEDHAAYKKLVLITLEVRETNFGAIHLYENHGYKQVGIRRDFYTLPTENAILMTKQLI